MVEWAASHVLRSAGGLPLATHGCLLSRFVEQLGAWVALTSRPEGALLGVGFA